MAKTSLIVKALDSNGKLLQKTVTDVNPEATNETLAAFGQKVNALTTHTYSGTDRVDKVNCDTEATPVDTRPELDVSFAPASISKDELISGMSSGKVRTISVIINAEPGKSYGSFVIGQDPDFPFILSAADNNSSKFYIYVDEDHRNEIPTNTKIKVAFYETPDYKVTVKEFTIT